LGSAKLTDGGSHTLSRFRSRRLEMVMENG
jgi:hypothetical protein